MARSYQSFWQQVTGAAYLSGLHTLNCNGQGSVFEWHLQLILTGDLVRRWSTD